MFQHKFSMESLFFGPFEIVGTDECNVNLGWTRIEEYFNSILM